MVDKNVKAEPTVLEFYGLVLTLEDSLSKYVNDSSFIEPARSVDEDFAEIKRYPDCFFQPKFCSINEFFIHCRYLHFLPKLIQITIMSFK